MEFNEVIRTRRSVRRFTEQKITEEEINTLLHAAMNAPSACRKDPWDFYVIENEEVLEQLKASSRYTNYTAPLAVIVCGDRNRFLDGDNAEYWIQDCSAATENLLLAAVDLGLGAVWCGIHPQKEPLENVKRILNLPENDIPLNVIFIGHPAQQPVPADRYSENNVYRIR